MKNFLYTYCALLGLISLTNCTKENVAKPDKEKTHENSALTATIEDVTTKTQLDGVHVTWKEGDQIAIQRTSEHQYNATTLPGQKDKYVTTFGIYNLAGAAANTKIGKFNFDSSDEKSIEKIDGNEEFFAFYPASFCSGDPSNGYFYITFPEKQKYENVIGEKFPLPMYGIGKDKNIEFKYAGVVIKLKVWSKVENMKIQSCVMTADGLYKKAFTYINKKNNWESLQRSYKVNYLTVEMDNPIKLSTDEQHPTEIPIVVPLTGKRTLTNLKFSINCIDHVGKHAGCELKKTSGLEVIPGTIVNFPSREIELDYIRMVIDDGVEGEYDIDEIKKAKKSIKLIAPDNIRLKEATFKEIIEATKSLNNTDNPEKTETLKSLDATESSNRQIIVDLSETTAEVGVIQGLDGNVYKGFCGGQTKDSGIKNISELRLPKGITTIMNMAFSNSDYKKIVLPATLTKISGMPASGCDGLRWEVAEGNKIFWTDNGALYGIKDTNIKTLVALNGGSGETYSIQEGTQEIGAYSMYENSVLTTLALHKSIQKIGENGLGETPSLTTIIVYGIPIFNPSTGSNTVGNPNVVKTLYVDEQQYETYMQRIKEYNEKYKIDLLKKKNWQRSKLNEDTPIPAKNPAKETKTN
mgnify:CR=1 FL=1